jgi:glutamyl-tRNA synthetase
VLELLKPRVKRLGEFATLGGFFFVDTVEYDETAVEKHLRISGMREHLEALDRAFAALTSFDAVSVETEVRRVAHAAGLKPATLIHATRVALTGRTVSPGLFEVAALVGRDRTRARLAEAIRKSV